MKTKRPRYALDDLLTKAEASGQSPLPPEEREWIDAPAVGRERLGSLLTEIGREIRLTNEEHALFESLHDKSL